MSPTFGRSVVPRGRVILPSVAFGLAACVAAAPARGSAQTVSPSFDCTEVASAVEALICRDLELARLDQLAANAFDALLRRVDLAGLIEQQRLFDEWLVERNNCSMADDTRTCVRESYVRRLARVRAESSLLSAPQRIQWVCNDDRQVPLYTTFDNDSDPPSVAVTYGNDQAAATLERSASGARYAGAGIEFWDRGRDALVTWRGRRLICRR